MNSEQTLARSMHDLGAAAWFGGALMGAVGLHGGSGAVGDADSIRVASEGWRAWQPWKTAGLAAHVAGSVSLLWGNKSRLAAQRGAMTVNLVKTGVFLAALGADLYAASLGRSIAEEEPKDVSSAVEPDAQTADEVADTQRRLRIVQWVVPALTGANIVLGAKMGEQQRPTNVRRGFLERLTGRD